MVIYTSGGVSKSITGFIQNKVDFEEEMNKNVKVVYEIGDIFINILLMTTKESEKKPWLLNIETNANKINTINIK